MVAPTADEFRLPLPADYAPASPLEDRIVNGACPVRSDRVRLANEVLSLYRAAAHLAHDASVASRWPPERIGGLSIDKVAAHLARALEQRFTRELKMLGWTNTFDALKTATEVSLSSEAIDVAPRLRGTLDVVLRSQVTTQAEALALFRIVLDIVGPIFAGEVTREDLSP